MNNNNNRPRFLTLWQIRLPVAGVVSILHRISGVLMLLAFPLLLYLFQLSLQSAEGFAAVRNLLTVWPLQLLVLLLTWLFVHHLFAGLRVMLIDMEWGSGLQAARRSAWLVLLGAIALTIIGAMR